MATSTASSRAEWLTRRAAVTGEGRESFWQVAMLGLVLVELAVRAATGTELPGLLVVPAVVAAASTALMLTTPTDGPTVVPRCIAAVVGNVLVFGLLLALVPELLSGFLVLLSLSYLGRLQPMRGVAYAALSVPVCYLGPPVVLGQGVPWPQAAMALTGLFISLVIASTCWAWKQDRADRDHQQTVVETLVQAVDVGLVLLDDEGRYQLINPRHHDFIALAHPVGERGVEGERDAQVYLSDRVTPVPSEDRPSVRAAAGEEFSGEVITVGRPGTPEQRSVAVSARAVRGADGSWQGAVLAYHDVTAAMQALHAKDDFIAMISHELRTPLTSIIGYLDLAADTPGVPSAALAHLEVAERNTHRMNALVGDLLYTAGASDGSLEVDLRPVRLQQLVADAVEGLRSYAGRQGVVLHLELEAVPAVAGDAARLSLVVANLVSNAVKYSNGAGAVTVQVCAVDGAARLAVVDQGVGMSPPEVGAAFSRFFRAPAFESQSIAGAGLGLPISRSIVDRHGGRIWLESSPGRGTTAVVELPLPVGATSATTTSSG